MDGGLVDLIGPVDLMDGGLMVDRGPPKAPVVEM